MLKSIPQIKIELWLTYSNFRLTINYIDGNDYTIQLLRENIKASLNFDEKTLEEKADAYSKFFTTADKEKVEEFVSQIDDMIKSDNVLTTADIGLEEREF